MKKAFALSIALLVIASISCSRRQESEAPLRFAVIGDLNGAFEDSTASDTAARELFREMKLIHPDFVFVTGDAISGLISDSLSIVKEWRQFQAATCMDGCPVFVTPGNHDIWSDLSRNVFLTMNGLQESFYFKRIKGALIIALDSNERDPKRQDSQIMWLRYLLGKAKKDRVPAYIFTHFPLLESKEFSHPMKMDIRFRTNILEVCKYSGARYIFSGHLPTFQHIVEEPFEQFISGGGGQTLAPGVPVVRPHFLYAVSRGKSLDVSLVGAGALVPVKDIAFQKAAAFPVDSLVEKAAAQAESFTQYESKTFGCRYSIPDNLIRLGTVDTKRQYTARYMFPDRVSTAGLTIVAYGKSVEEGMREDVETFRKKYANGGHVLSTVSEGKWARPDSIPGYEWEGKTDKGKRIKSVYFSKDGCLYCLIYMSTAEDYMKNYAGFDRLCKTFVFTGKAE